MGERTYNEESIKQLKGAERVRLRPGVMFGSDDITGAFHTFKEILGNSLDEVRAGFGKMIEVVYHKDNSISIRDFGRGVPMGFNKLEGKYNWELVFNELFAGGKYDNEEEGNYKFSVGLNGLGAAAVQYSSEFFRVVSYKGNKVYEKVFEKGYPLDDKLGVSDNVSGETGTFVHWKVDDEVFTNTNFNFSMFKNYCEGQAHINAVDFKLTDEASGEQVLYQGRGIQFYLEELLGDNVIEIISKKSKSKGAESNKHYTAECEIVLAITEEVNSKQLYFHNTSTMTRGVHMSAFEDAVNAFFKNIGKRNGVTIQPYDYRDYLSVIVSTYSSITSFSNQTKDGVTNVFIYGMVYDTIKDMLEESIAMGKDSVMSLVNNVVAAALARKRAKEIEAQERLIRKTTNRRAKAEKYVDCTENDPVKRELFIVEGDSAEGACKLARDRRFQAILPVKGKPLNCLKANIEKILGNKEIQDIISTIGTGVDIDGVDSELFDVDRLQFNKIIFCTDADADGYQIRVLLYTIFYRLMPQLLRDGYIYIAETPLFEIETSRGVKFAYNNDEKDNIIEECKNSGVAVRKVSRSKGLGANNPDMLWETTMNPETRNLVQLDIDIQDQIVRDISNMLFGEDFNNERKNFIFSMLGAGLMELAETVEGMSSLEEEGFMGDIV